MCKYRRCGLALKVQFMQFLINANLITYIQWNITTGIPPKHRIKKSLQCKRKITKNPQTNKQKTRYFDFILYDSLKDFSF